jgi:hypothetical protein
MLDLETWELLSYVVTTIGFPAAIVAFLYEQKKERDSDEEEVYQLLSDNYQDFLKILLDNPDLRLFSSGQTRELSIEQRERMLIIFNILISLFERAFLLLYEPRMSSKQARRWSSWEDYRISARSCRRCCRVRIPSSSSTFARSWGPRRAAPRPAPSREAQSPEPQSVPFRFATGYSRCATRAIPSRSSTPSTASRSL